MQFDLAFYYLFVGSILFVLGFSGQSSHQNIFRVLLFALACIGIKPGVIGEEFGAIGVFLLIPFSWMYFSARPVISSSIKLSMALLAGLFAWDSLSSGFSNLAISLQAAAVSLIVFTAALGFMRKSSNLVNLFKVGFVVVVWQMITAMATYFLPNEFPLSNSLELGRSWVYLGNSLGGIFVGNSYEFASTMKLIGLNSIEYLPRLTGFWGEPGIIALLAVFLSSIHLQLHRRWDAKIQIFVVAAILVTQSLGGILAYLMVVLGSIFLNSSRDITKIRRVSRNIILLAAAALVLPIVAAQVTTKFSDTTSSLTERSGENGIITLLTQIVTNPLGNQSGGSLNLLQAAVSSGLPTLLLGLALYFVVPLRAMRESGFSVLFIVPLVAVVFIQPPFLPLWPLLLGLFYGQIETISSANSKALPQPRLKLRFTRSNSLL